MFFGGSHFVGVFLSHPRVGSVLQALGDKHLEKVRSFIGEGGGEGRRGGSLVNFLPVGEGQTCFILRKMTYLISFMVENI